MVVAIDRAARYVWVKGLPRCDAETVARAVEEFLAAFTDRFAVHKQGKPMGTHHLDRVCREHGITHRLIRPYHPQTNGMVERFTRRLSEALRRQARRSRPIVVTGFGVAPSGTLLSLRSWTITIGHG